MEKLKFAVIGCSGMGRRHLHGLALLATTPFLNLDLAAACDLDRSRAEAFADEARGLIGARPQVHTSIAAMLRDVPGLTAVLVATDASSHRLAATQCLEAGLHVLCEKPLGVTVRECGEIVAAAVAARRVLSVAENFRRDPMNRLVRALISDGAIGAPRLMLETCIGGRDAMVSTPSRHGKHTGTVVIDSGVHNADIIRYYLGEPVAIWGESRLHEKVRRNLPPADATATARDSWWSASVAPPMFEAAGEDATYSQIRFRSGAICQWVMDRAGHGLARDRRSVYGATGSIEAPGDRNGRPVRLHRDDGTVIDDERILDYAPSYRLTAVAAALFGDARLWRYDLPFNGVDQRLLALELYELGDCVARGVAPEVTGLEALTDVALAYAPIESGRLGRAVTLDEVRSGAVASYQDEIHAMLAQGCASR